MIIEKKEKIIIWIVLVLIPISPVLLLSILDSSIMPLLMAQSIITIPITIFAVYIFNWTGNVCSDHAKKKREGYFAGLLIPYVLTLITNLFVGLLASIILTTFIYKKKK